MHLDVRSHLPLAMVGFSTRLDAGPDPRARMTDLDVVGCNCRCSLTEGSPVCV